MPARAVSRRTAIKTLGASAGALTTADLDRRVSLRGQPLSVVDAIQRQLIHYGQHVGQIVFIAKHRRWRTWESLSMPKKR